MFKPLPSSSETVRSTGLAIRTPPRALACLLITLQDAVCRRLHQFNILGATERVLLYLSPRVQTSVLISNAAFSTQALRHDRPLLQGIGAMDVMHFTRLSSRKVNQGAHVMVT